MHHLNSWIKIDQLDVTCFIISLFTTQNVSNVSTSIFRSLRLIVGLFHVLQPSYGYHTTPPKPNHNVTPTRIVPEQYNPWNNSTNKSKVPEDECTNIRNMLSSKWWNTHIEPEQCNTWNKATISRKLLKMDVLTFETCWAVNGEIIKQVTSSWSIFIQLSRWCTVQ